MDIPNKITFAGITYTVKKVPQYSKELEGNWGMHGYKEQMIWLNEDLTGDVLEQVFLHEVTHAICEIINAGQDENFVERFSQILLQVVQQLTE